MGGCRCTYRNCTVRSDGTTHLFHYPVFDKYRCHQWLTNAQRLDFLNLKVSQLKNRVVCQHHFTDDMFMNYKKDKLKCFAVPTEDGPFCESTTDDAETNTVLYPINVEHIENELINSNTDKKAKFSVKYGDFLTNCELMELNNAEQNRSHKQELNNSELNKSSTILPLKQELANEKKESFIIYSHKRKLSLSEEEAENKMKKSQKCLVKRKTNTKPGQRQPIIKVHYVNKDVYTDKKYLIDIDTTQPPPSEPIKGGTSDIQNFVSSTTEETPITCGNVGLKNQQRESQRSSKVKILSEEPFCQPLPALPALVPVPPTYVLHVPGRKNDINMKLVDSDNNKVNQFEQSDKELSANVIQDVSNLEVVICNPPETKINENLKPKLNQQDNSFTNKQEHNNNSLTPISQRSRAMSDERTAAIQEKRKFNKKLRDIITDSLNLLDEQANENVKSKSEIMYQPEFPSIQNQLMSFLDNRLNKMEEKLLKKIDSNTHEIIKMKNVLGDFKKDAEKNYSAFIKTNETDELQKKNLFHEISKYLSSDAKSLVYEELFINKHVQSKSILPELSRRTSRRHKQL